MTNGDDRGKTVDQVSRTSGMAPEWRESRLFHRFLDPGTQDIPKKAK